MIALRTKIPGPRSSRVLAGLKEKNGGWSVPYPYVHSGYGKGSYCEDIDGNMFLDFASQIASNPLGYNHPGLLEVLKEYRQLPVKYAGQDFATEEHLEMIESLLSISPKQMGAAFLINSGAEAVENAVKICTRFRPGSRFGVSMEGGFHGRTLGALSLTNSKAVHKKGYPRLPMLRLPYSDSAGASLERMLEQEGGANDISFVILECFQGEGGYRIAPEKMVKDIREITREDGIPLICDEVQSGIGRTGKWWAFEHFGITPDVFTSAKALQAGAVVSSKAMFPKESGALSSTWGGGHVLDLAIGIETIRIIKKERMLASNRKNGSYLLKGLKDIAGTSNQRGLGLMAAFDLPSGKIRDNVIIECVRNGLLLLGCGSRCIRVIPPFIATRGDIDLGLGVLESAVKKCTPKSFKHTGNICSFMDCGRDTA